MERIVFYGKGGIGKSTIAANVTAALALAGQRVLHIGCDPKQDSTLALMRGERLATIVERFPLGHAAGAKPRDLVARAPCGADCIESGGPEPGRGCGGRAISLTIELAEECGLFDPARYDVVVFDVLGDVVCGGFAAPLWRGAADKVFVVTSAEGMALYAANNILRGALAVAGARLRRVALIVNRAEPEHPAPGPVERFGALVAAPILAVLPRDPLFAEAEREQTTVVERFPDTPLARALTVLAKAVVAPVCPPAPAPTALSPQAFLQRVRTGFEAPAGEAVAGGPVAAGDAAAAPGTGAPAAGRAPERPAILANVGPWATRALAECLGLPFGRPAWRLTRLCLAGRGRVRFDVRRHDGLAVAFWATPEAVERVFCRSPDLSIHYETDAPVAELGPLLEALRPRLSALRRAQLVRILRIDALAEGRLPREAAAPAPTAAPPVAESPVLNLPRRRPEAWRRFTAPHALGRAFLGRLRGRCVEVLHADAECRHSGPGSGGLGVAFHALPFPPANAPPRRPSNPEEGFAEPAANPTLAAGQHRGDAAERADETLTLTTSLGLANALHGGLTLLTRTLRAVECSPDPPRCVSVVSSCLAATLGEPIHDCVRGFSARSGIPAADLSGLQRPYEALVAALAPVEPGLHRAAPNAIVLVGFPDTPGLRWLLRVLQRSGVDVAGRILPDLSPRALIAGSPAAIQVFYETEAFQDVYARLRQRANMTSLTPAAPYGPAATRQWLETVATACGAEYSARLRAVWDAEWPAYAVALGTLGGQAGQERLGFVVDDDSETDEPLAATRRMSGIPVVALVEALGFPVDVLAPRRPAANDRQRPPAALAPAPAGRRIYRFATPAGLRRALRQSEARAFYSEFESDARLIGAGKAPFGPDVFDMGLPGSLATLDRLLTRCHLPIFARRGARRVGTRPAGRGVAP